MPRVCEFYGIVIYMYFQDHGPPHFHAIYRDSEAMVAIGSNRVIRGFLPKRAIRLVRAWARRHRRELSDNWDLARQGRPLSRIAPLD